jgi:hypothetical protein
LIKIIPVKLAAVYRSLGDDQPVVEDLRDVFDQFVTRPIASDADSAVEVSAFGQRSQRKTQALERRFLAIDAIANQRCKARETVDGPRTVYDVHVPWKIAVTEAGLAGKD